MNYEDYGLWTMKTIDYGGFGPIMQTPLDRAGDYTADILESALYVIHWTLHIRTPTIRLYTRLVMCTPAPPLREKSSPART
eukprot:1194332-Prorocentrum_minimum.AAC.4